MQDLEIQFQAPGPATLLDALRDAAGDGGLKPSRKRVLAWVGAGRVRVEGEVVEDATRALLGGETVDLGPAGADSPASDSRPSPDAESILHLDRHLLVIAYEPPVAVRPDGEDLADGLARALEAAAVRDLTAHPVPRPDARASGLVVGALSAAAERALADAFASGAARLTIEASVAAQDGRPHRVREDVASLARGHAALAARGWTVCPVPGPGAPATRPLLLHVAAVRLPHPRTGRDLGWELPLPPTFAPDPG